jgi:hypothetical protein
MVKSLESAIRDMMAVKQPLASKMDREAARRAIHLQILKNWVAFRAEDLIDVVDDELEVLDEAQAKKSKKRKSRRAKPEKAHPYKMTYIKIDKQTAHYKHETIPMPREVPGIVKHTPQSIATTIHNSKLHRKHSADGWRAHAYGVHTVPPPKYYGLPTKLVKDK